MVKGAIASVSRTALSGLLFAVFSASVGLFYLLRMNNFEEPHILKVSSNRLPSTSDPYEFDISVNHYAFGPAFIKLFSHYKDASVTPSLAKAWRVENGGKNWEIDLREDVRFTNGDLVTAEKTLLSLKRIFFLANRSGSKLPLLGKLLDSEQLVSPAAAFAGLKSSGNRISFKFKEPVENLPEELSFGLYGVVHPSNYDDRTGEWNNNNVIYSGPYFVSDQSLNSFGLTKRADYPVDLAASNSASVITLSADEGARQVADIVDGFVDEDVRTGYKFFGNSSSDILYIYVFSWNLKESPWSDKDFRSEVREQFYARLSASGFRPTKSFFPIVIPGVSEVSASKSPAVKTSDLQLNVFFKSPVSLRAPKLKAAKNSFKEVVDRNGWHLTEAADLTLTDVRKIVRGESTSRLDVGARITSMGAENPRDTFRFMLSREGIFLPDTDGRIQKILSQPDFSLQDANEVLYDQAVVWPVFHLSMGFWSSDRIDLSRYNTSLPLSELQWIGVK